MIEARNTGLEDIFEEIRVCLHDGYGEAKDPINDAFDQVDLGHTYTLSYFEGGVRIDGQP